MDDVSAGLFRSIGRVVAETVEEAIERHEDRLHIPPPRRGRVQAIPFPMVQLSDVQICKALEMLHSGSTLQEAAETVNAPVPALERALAEYRPAWRSFLAEREAGA